MKAETYKVSVEARLILTGRELELLNHICSYDNKKDFIDGMVSSSYSHGVTKEDMVELFENLRKTTSNLLQVIQATNKQAFEKNQL